MVFGYYAAAIGRAFFPTKNEYASLMLSLMTFGTGYLMRPLGAIILGAYIDHHGRRKGLLLTLALMAVGTLSIGIMPGYETIGFFAPLLVVLGRLVQGLSAGVEIGGVSVYLAEIATPGRKGFFVSWQSGSQQVAVIFAALIGLTLSATLRPEEMAGWGWRVPLLIGSMLIPFLLLLRRSLTETDEFIARKHHPGAAEIWRTVMTNPSSWVLQVCLDQWSRASSVPVSRCNSPVCRPSCGTGHLSRRRGKITYANMGSRRQYGVGARRHFRNVYRGMRNG